jgi:hypothetical protein
VMQIINWCEGGKQENLHMVRQQHGRHVLRAGAVLAFLLSLTNQHSWGLGR